MTNTDQLKACPFCGSRPAPNSSDTATTCFNTKCPIYSFCIPIYEWNTRTPSEVAQTEGGEAVAWQRRDLGTAHPQLGTQQWSHWRDIGRSEFDEMTEYKQSTCCSYIELRPLYTHPSATAVEDARLREAVAKMRKEMIRYLPVLEALAEDPDVWGMATEGTGIATLNGYRKAIDAAISTTSEGGA